MKVSTPSAPHPRTTLGDECEFIRGVTFAEGDAAPTPAAGMTPILRAGNIADDLNVDSDLVWVPCGLVDENQLLRKNDIVVCMSSGSSEVVGKTARVSAARHASVGSFCGIIRARDPDKAAYLSYYFRSSSFRAQRDRVARGANIQNLRFSQFEKMPLVIPPDQRRIAGILDKADRLRRMRRYALELSDQFLPALFLRMFGDPAANSMRWSVAELGDHLSYLTSGSRGWAKYYSDDGDLFLRIENVGRGMLLLDDIIRVRPPHNAETRRTAVAPGDVLLSITADLGRCALIPERFPRAYVNQHLALMRVEDINGFFLAAQLASPWFRSVWDRLDRSAVKSGLNFDDIRGVGIIVPPQSEQERYTRAARQQYGLRT